MIGSSGFGMSSSCGWVGKEGGGGLRSFGVLTSSVMYSSDRCSSGGVCGGRIGML